jgi:hypothetical protein
VWKSSRVTLSVYEKFFPKDKDAALLIELNYDRLALELEDLTNK